MKKRYSEMTMEELRSEIAKLQEKAQKAEQMGIINEVAVHERKIAVAKSYMLDSTTFNKGDIHEIKGSEKETFEIAYLNGIFAWGHRNGGTEKEAIPISLLGEKRKMNV